MAIRQRGNRYQVDVKVKGERVRAAAETLEGARQLESEIRATLMKGGSWDSATPRNGSSVTLGMLRDHVWKHKWSKLKAGEAQKRNAELVCELLGDDTPANKIDLAGLYKLRERFAAQGNSDSTINRKLAALSTMLTEAKAMGWIKDKPKIPKTKEAQGRIRYLSQEEEHDLLAWADHLGYPEYRRLFRVALDTGARMGELRKLQIRDVDFKHSLVSFWDRKGGNSGSVPLYPETVAALRGQIKAHWGEGRVNPTAKVWPEVSERKVNEVWDRIRAKMGLTDDPQFVPHVMRHTCASRMVQNGVDLLAVKDWLGHLTLSTTLRYSHLAPNNLFRARDLMQSARQGEEGSRE